MQPIETFEVKGLTVKLFHDADADSPRDWDNLGTMVVLSTQYSIGDKHSFSNEEEIENHIRETCAVYLPIYLHDYGSGNVKLSTDSRLDIIRKRLAGSIWSDRQRGALFITSERIVKEYGEDNAETRAKAFACLESELETMNQYLSGDVYGFEVERPDATCKTCKRPGHDQFIDSCWGFYGLEYCKQEATQSAEAHATPKRKTKSKKR